MTFSSIRLRGAASLPLIALVASACASSTSPAGAPAPVMNVPVIAAPSPDPRIGLKAGLFDAGEAVWNMRVVSKTPPPREFAGVTNSDLAFSGNYVFQGNYNGFMVWDITNPATPTLVKPFVCPASQSDVSVYKNLLFVSGEGFGGRLDCGTQGIPTPQGQNPLAHVSHDRLRGIRIFDITDIRNPKYIGNVQTCRGSHTHTVLAHPRDPANVYVYVSGSSPVRPTEELAGCVGGAPSQNPNSAEFRIEVIRVPLANPAAAAIVSSPRIFQDLVGPPTHGASPADAEQMAAMRRQAEEARARGAFVAEFPGQPPQIAPEPWVVARLDSIVKARGGTGAAAATGADSAALRGMIQRMVASVSAPSQPGGARPGPTSCHDITVYPEIGLAGGACEGYGLLIDINDPVNPRRIAAVSDSNFSYWHSATFNNDGTKVLFSDEWGGGGGAKCRTGDPKEWGADAIFTIENRQMKFQSYFKLPVAQTTAENCVAHNGSLIPIPGRDVMVQAWYQGGINVFDWTDAKNPREIAFFDRGPVDATRMGNGGSWSVYWYNGVIVSSEIGRGLDILELTPSAAISQNEIDAAKTVKLEYLNTQGQPKFVWPATFALAKAYVDQLERSQGLAANRLAAVRQALSSAESASGSARSQALNTLASELNRDAGSSRDATKVRTLAATVTALANAR